jgi:hypothetical protein
MIPPSMPEPTIRMAGDRVASLEHDPHLERVASEIPS